MTYSIEINELNKFLSIGDTVTLLDVRRKTDYEATPKKNCRRRVARSRKNRHMDHTVADSQSNLQRAGELLFSFC